MKRFAVVLSVLIVLLMAGCATGQSTKSDASNTVSTTSSVQKPKASLDKILHDVVSIEDEMTGEREIYSSYAFKKTEYKGQSVITSIDKHNTMTTIAPFALFLYQDGDDLEYRVRLKYRGDNWIFFDKWLIKVDDDDVKTFSLGSLTSDTNVSDKAKVSETYRFSPSDDMLDVLDSVANADTCTMRFSGTKGNFTFDLTDNDIKAVKHIITMYNEYHS